MNKIQIQSIGFDLDGTIVDSVPWFLDLYQSVLASVAGINISQEDLLARLGPPEKEVFKNIAPNSYEECLRTFRDLSYSSISELNLFPEIICSLELCNQYNYNVGLITGRSQYLAETILDHFDLKKHFHFFSFGKKGTSAKADALTDFSKYFSTDTNKCAYLGDFSTDFEDAKKVGMHPLIAGWGVINKSDFKYKEEPFFFTTVDGFINWLKDNAYDSRV